MMPFPEGRYRGQWCNKTSLTSLNAHSGRPAPETSDSSHYFGQL